MSLFLSLLACDPGADSVLLLSIAAEPSQRSIVGSVEQLDERAIVTLDEAFLEALDHDITHLASSRANTTVQRGVGELVDHVTPGLTLQAWGDAHSIDLLVEGPGWLEQPQDVGTYAQTCEEEECPVAHFWFNCFCMHMEIP